MATLTGQTPAVTYPALIKFEDNGPLTAALRRLSDGLGGQTQIFVSTVGQQFRENTVFGDNVLNTTRRVQIDRLGTTNGTKSLFVTNPNVNGGVRFEISDGDSETGFRLRTDTTDTFYIGSTPNVNLPSQNAFFARHTNAGGFYSGASTFVTANLSFNANYTQINGNRIIRPSGGLDLTIDSIGGSTYMRNNQVSGNLDWWAFAGGLPFTTLERGSIVYLGGGNTTGGLCGIATKDPSSAPSGTVRGPIWNLGQVKAQSVTLDANNYVEIAINGTLYKLALVN